MKPYIFTIFLGLTLLAPSATFAQQARTGKADIDQKVSAALVLAKSPSSNYDSSGVDSLCKNYGESILPYFRRHILDKNLFVRLAVEDAAAQFSSPQAKEMLVQLVRDQETSVMGYAIRDFVRVFPIAALSPEDAKRFNDSLLIQANRGNASSVSLLLLANFPQTPKTIVLLNSLHTSGSDTMSLEGALPVEKNIILDVTLTQLGDKAAGERIAALLHGGPVASLTDVIVTISFQADPSLLLQEAELLKDTRLTNRTRGGAGYGGPGTPLVSLPYKRVCDLALDEFAKRKPSGVSLDTSVESRRPFTPEELDKSEGELRAFYKVQADRK